MRVSANLEYSRFDLAGRKIYFISLILLLAIRVYPQTDSPKIVSVSKISDEMRTNVDGARALTLAEAIDLALKQASNFKSAQINEQIAAEDIKQAKAGFYPKVSVLPNVIYTSPSFGSVRAQSGRERCRRHSGPPTAPARRSS